MPRGTVTTSAHIMCAPYNHASYSIRSHIQHVCLAVTCHVHIWSNQSPGIFKEEEVGAGSGSLINHKVSLDIISDRNIRTGQTYHWRELPQLIFLSRQTFQNVFVVTLRVFCRDKTRLLSRQKYDCRDKSMIVATSTSAPLVCRDKSFVTANIFLWRQKTCFVATKQKRFFVAAPASVTNQPWLGSQSEHLSLLSLRKYPRASMLGHLPLLFAREGEN